MSPFAAWLALLVLTAGPAPEPRPILLKAAHLFDAKAGQLVTPGAVLVRGKTILAVGPDALQKGAASSAEVIDLHDATLVPGFIDAHTHLTFDVPQNGTEGLTRWPAEQSLHAARNAQLTLAAGFTTVRDLGSHSMIDVGLRNAIADGVTDGPRMLVAVSALGARGGHADRAYNDSVKPPGVSEGICAGADQCRDSVRWMVRSGGDVIKLVGSGGVLSMTDPVDNVQLDPSEVQAIVSEAHRWNRKVAVHSHGDTAARIALEAGADSIEHGSFLSTQTLALIKKLHRVLVPTAVASEWMAAHADSYPPVMGTKARSQGAAHANMLRTAIKMGLILGVGSDSGGVVPHGLNAKEIELLARAGMTPAHALQAATVVNAELLGLRESLGSLEPGKLADVIAVPGNPLEDLSDVERVGFVMKDGRIFKRPN